MPKQPYVLTPEQVALQEERRRKRAEVKANAQEDFANSTKKGTIVAREWRQIVEHAPGARTLKIMTWNLLAQCLVRRELFPNSDCLRGSQRMQMTFEELFSPGADVLCLQEVDRLEKILPALDKAGYDHHYAAGTRKKHGCLIAWRRNAFARSASRTVHYDDTHLHSEGDQAYRKGLSFCTRNIANIVALQRTDDSGEGFIIATTHLFWHPAYAYERTRQLGILKREALRFRAAHNAAGDWPAILAGDFNLSPESAAYALLHREALLPAQRARLAASRVVHLSVDPMVPKTSSSGATAKHEEEEEGAEGADTDPDRVIINARQAVADDGLLDDDGLEALYASHDVILRSAYDEGLRALGDRASACGDRLGIDSLQRGAFEPEYTNYTFYWKLTLDYIFVIDPPKKRSTVLGLLAPPKAASLEPGLPKKGVSASDHVSLCAELQWT